MLHECSRTHIIFIPIKVVNAKVPLSEMFGYITDLRTITSGRATSTMEFSSFENAPKNVSDEVISNIKGDK